jgi:cyclopropane fatty-acyl-phospholipid synthase-like methyltransferase
MLKEYYQIKDKCRAGLLKYLAEAVSLLPKINNPKILDIGCGTGVPTVWLAENFGGTITAIDTDKSALEWLQVKITDKKLEDQITTINISFFDLKTEPPSFDIILAEGFLNIVGFKEGFFGVMALLKEGGYFVIHDEYKGHEMKCDFIRENYCDLVGTVLLDDTVWWNHYYKKLEIEISNLNIWREKQLYESDIKEIELYKLNPSQFQSIYYIIRRLIIKP